MKKLVGHTEIDGEIIAPPSKSVAQRALALATLAHGRSHLHNLGISTDVNAAIEACRSLGARITGSPTHLVVDGGTIKPAKTINCGESGLAMRMFAAIAATQNVDIELVGKGSLINRPMDFVSVGLQELGAQCRTSNGLQPIRVRGPLKGGEIWLNCAQSSQALTGLLIASVLARDTTTIHAENLCSSPYINLTISMMQQFGVKVDVKPNNVFTVKTGNAYQPCNLRVEGDWSGAAFWLVAGAIAGRVLVKNLDPHSLQADTAIVDALRDAGAQVEIDEKGISVQRAKLQAFTFDATHCPDLFPPLVALASNCLGTSTIKGIHRLQSKESDRGAALAEEFGRLGIDITLDSNHDTMHIAGRMNKKINGDNLLIYSSLRTTHGKPEPTQVRSHNDHRIAMALAISTLADNRNIEIDGAEAVYKSYPEFWNVLDKLTKK